MPPEHEKREDCRTDFKDLFDKNLALAKDKIGIRLFAILVAVVLGAYGYTTVVGSSHKDYAIKQEVTDADNKLYREIKEVKDKVEDMRIEIKSDMQRMEDKILDAIKRK